MPFEVDTKKIKRLSDKVKFFRKIIDGKVIRQIETITKRAVANNIALGKRDVFTGSLWAPWSTLRAKERTKKGNAGKGLLFDTGNLIKSITTSVTIGNKVSTIEIDNTARYAPFLEFGNANHKVYNRGSGRLPARPFMGLSGQSENLIGRVVNNKIDELARNL